MIYGTSARTVSPPAALETAESAEKRIKINPTNLFCIEFSALSAVSSAAGGEPDFSGASCVVWEKTLTPEPHPHRIPDAPAATLPRAGTIRGVKWFRGRILAILSRLSLALCLAIGVPWIISYWRICLVGVHWESWPKDSVWRSRGVGVRLVEGYWIFNWGGNEFYLDHPEGIVQGWDRSSAQAYKLEHPGGMRGDYVSFSLNDQRLLLPNSSSQMNRDGFLLGIPRYYGFGYKYDFSSTMSRTDIGHYVIAPAWVLLILLLPLPAVSGYRWYRRSRRSAVGHCPTCGYDLRASPNRCPECGTAVPPKVYS
jgi:hypothetical protein